MSEATTAKPAVPAKPTAQPPAPEKFDDKPPTISGVKGDLGELAKPLAIDRCFLREHKDPGIWICLERGTPYDKVFEPSFWANVALAKRFEPGQTITVRNDEMTVFAELIILDCGRNWATVAEYSRKTLDELTKSRPPLKQQPRHKVEHAGPVEKWRIVRDDNQVIRSRFDSEAQAQTYLNEYLRRLGA